MAKTILRIQDDEFNFLLFGIVSQYRDFRVCREVNQMLELALSRGDDYPVFLPKRNEEQLFSFFQFQNEQEDQFYILSNKGEKGLLIPEQKQMDFFLLIKPGMSQIDPSEIQARLKQVRIFLGVYPIEVLKLKSKENLLF